MPTVALTKRTIDALKPGPKPVIVWDADLPGFGLKVSPAGKRTYVYQYRIGGRAGRTVRKSIGLHGAWTPDQARDEAKRLRRETEAGIDPVQAERDAKAAKERAERAAAVEQERAEREANDAERLRIDAIAARFIDHVRTDKPRSLRFAEPTIRLHILPAVGSVRLPELTRNDVRAMLDRLPHGSTALRRNVFATLRWLVAWAVEADDLPSNPMVGMKAPTMAKARDRVLTDAELTLVWRAAGSETSTLRAFYRLLLLTGQRRNEVAAIDWRELDRDAAEWKLPAGRSKNAEGHTVPLSALAIAELDALAGGDRWPKRGLALSSTGTTPLSGFSRAKARLDAAMLDLARADAEQTGHDPDTVELPDWRLHDLRRSLATGLQRLGVRFEVTEAVLNHLSGSRAGVAGVYQRHGWADEKRSALDAWARHIEQLLSPVDQATNVISLAKAG